MAFSGQQPSIVSRSVTCRLVAFVLLLVLNLSTGTPLHALAHPICCNCLDDYLCSYCNSSLSHELIGCHAELPPESEPLLTEADKPPFESPFEFWVIPRSIDKPPDVLTT